MKKHSRPSAQTVTDEQIIDVICEMGEKGGSLKSICEARNLVYRTVMNRIRNTEELTALDARARQDYARERARSLNEIAANEPDVQRARLMCDNIKWEAARVLPKEYGDKVIAEHQGNPEQPIAHSINIRFIKSDTSAA